MSALHRPPAGVLNAAPQSGTLAPRCPSFPRSRSRGGGSRRCCVGRAIAEVATTRPSYFFLTPPARLRRALPGRRTDALERRGKYLVAQLDDARAPAAAPRHDRAAVLERGVEPAAAARVGAGDPRARGAGRLQADEHTHLRLRFDDDGPEVFFRDARKFGKVQWLAPGARIERASTASGLDALAADGAALFAASRGRRVAVKGLLLDQAVLAGVGNIYADEALFLAPACARRARAGRVTRAECERIADALRRVLVRSIETGGSSISDYVAPDGSDGALPGRAARLRREGRRARLRHARSAAACSGSAHPTTARAVSDERPLPAGFRIHELCSSPW